MQGTGTFWSRIQYWAPLAVVLITLLNCGRVGTPSSGAYIGSDGSGSAPGATPQHPKLLSAYGFRPGWKVAGVDYAVGYPVGTTLVNPSSLSTLSMPGVTVNTTTQRVTVTGSNTTLEGIDFSLQGGWSVSVTGASGVTIKNCNFALSAAFGSTPAIQSDANSPNLYIGYNVIDGGGAQVTQLAPNTLLALGAGATVEYNWIKNSPADLIEVGAAPSGNSLVVQYNLLEGVGQVLNTDGNYIKFEAGTFDAVTIVYNTFDQYPGGQLGTGGINAVLPAGTGNVISTLEIGHNTMVSTGAPGVLSFMIATLPTQTTLGQVNTNYADVTGAIEFEYVGSSAANLTFSANVNMNSGGAL